MPLLLVGMMRPGPQRDDLLALRRAVGDGARMQLAGLDEAAVTDLVTTLAGGQPDGGLLRLADGAAGNPLYVTELVAALARSSSLTVTEAGTAELAGDSAPGSLSAAIADRLGFVTGSVREMLRVTAPGGRVVAVTPGQSALLDFGLRVMTGERGEDTFEGRRGTIVPAFEDSGQVEKIVQLPPVTHRVLPLYAVVVSRPR